VAGVTEIAVAPDQVRAWSREVRRSGRSIALVPTMGALHRGHLALVEDAGRLADAVVVSIFVNPLQFGDSADLTSYPTPIDDDVAACRAVGVDMVYAPTAATMYPAGFDTRVVPGSLAAEMEGRSRIGHFTGVATVVAKLFGAVEPDVAVFGEKDFQQLTIIRRMAADLDLGVRIESSATVRDHDGLALSSRNQRLSPVERAAAVAVPHSIAAARAVSHGPAPTVVAVTAAARQVLDAEPLAEIDYVTVFDTETLQPVERFDDRLRPERYRIAVAVRFGDVRLIDNAALFEG
jgi:pantoate--beta-alanine ligase